MSADYLTFVGLCADVIGAFLVSAEAIKLRNLRRLREHVLGPARGYVLPMEILVRERGSEMSLRGMVVFLVIHFVGGAIVLFSLIWAVGRFGIDPLGAVGGSIESLNVFVKLVAALPTIWLILAVVYAAGEIMHYVLMGVTALPIAFLETVEANTPDGTTGSVGFLFIFIGFVLQLAGLVGRNSGH